MEKRLIFLAASFLTLFYATSAVRCGKPDDNPLVRRVLVLHSYQQNMTWVRQIQRAVDDVLTPVQSNSLLYIENMDTKRAHTREYIEKLKELYAVKYRNIRLDLIICSDNYAFDFLLRERDTLFPGTPVVFCGVNFFREYQIANLTGFTGVEEKFDALSTVKLILELHPDVKQIYVVNDYLKTGRAWSEAMQVDFRALAGRVRIDYAPDAPFEDLLERLKNLDDGAVVLLGVYFGDSKGAYFTYELTGEMISHAAKVPVYCLLDFNMGAGPIGGKVINGYDQGFAAARIGLRILNGENVDDIPVLTEGATRYMFDYNRLKEYNISLESLPPESKIINLPVSFYDRHRNLIIGTCVMITVEMMIIVILLANVRRRRRAETMLRSMNETLEIRVRERTVEISCMNAELLESEEKYRNLIERAGAGFLIIQDGVFRYVNSRFADMIGYELSELIGLPYEKLLSAEQVEPLKERYNQRMRGENPPTSYEIVLQKKNGEQLDVEINAGVLNYLGRKADFVYIHDITARKRAEIQHKEAKEAAEAANRAKSMFIANMSHEIRTPLNAILGFSEILLEELLEDSQREYMKNVMNSGRALLFLIDDILDLSKIEAGKLRISPEPVLLENVLENINPLFLNKCQNKGISLTFETDEIVHDQVKLDDVRIKQILTNLIGNAVKFTSSGYVNVSVREKARRMNPDGLTRQIDIVFEITDTGIGIKDDQKQMIFEQFHQQEGQKLKQYGGVGLGLTITKRLVEMMNGTISVESEYGEGSRFRVDLHDVPVLETSVKSEVSFSAAAGGENIMFHPAFFLLVDDIESNRRIIKEFLKEQPLTFFEAEDAGQVYHILNTVESLDIVLMDLRLPGHDGWELTAAIKENPAFQNVPVIACSAAVMKADEADVSTFFDGFLRKPVTKNSLLTELRKFLSFQIHETVETRNEQHETEAACAGDIAVYLPGILDILENELLPLWREIESAYYLDDAIEFYNKIKAVCPEETIPFLTRYRDTLSSYLKNNDIDRIDDILKEFPRLIEDIKRL